MMKAFLLLVQSVLLLSACLCAQGNVVVNPGFETGTSSWTVEGPGLLNTDYSHSGSQSLFGISETTACVASQSFAVSGLYSVDLSAFYKVGANGLPPPGFGVRNVTTAPCVFALGLIVDGVEVKSFSSSFTYNHHDFPFGWTQANLHWTGLVGSSVAVRVSSRLGFETGQAFDDMYWSSYGSDLREYVDDVNMSLTQIPEPGSLLVMLSGVCLLAAMRKKR